MLGFTFRGLEEQRIGQREFARKSGGVHGSEEYLYPVRKAVIA